MLTSANMSNEVYNYFKDYDLSKVADTLLEMYDFTNLPQKTGPREKECRLNINNEYYISLYNTLGPRSKKISLGRLFEYAYNMDVLALPRFNDMKLSDKKDNPVRSLVDRAYRALLEAQKHDSSPMLKDITRILYEYREALDNEEN